MRINKPFDRSRKSAKKLPKTRATPSRPAFTAELEIESLGAKGDGIASLDGTIIHIPYTMEKEKVRARIIGNRGLVEELIEPSPERVQPVCKHFTVCGGCSLQHIGRENIANFKKEQIRKALSREGIGLDDDKPIEIISSPEIPNNIRRRATFSVARAEQYAQFGFHARNTHKIVSLEECHILKPDLYAFYEKLPSLIDVLPMNWKKFTLQINSTRAGFDVNVLGNMEHEELSAKNYEALGAVLGKLPVTRFSINGEALLTFTHSQVLFGEVPVPIPPGAFLQASDEGQRALLDAVLKILEKNSISSGVKIADLFCGCGAFALPLSRDFHVFGCDNHQGAIDALASAHRGVSGLKPVSAQMRDLFRQPLLPDELDQFEVVIFDPPRAGAPAQAKQLAQAHVPVIIGVSCNPKTFATDARLLKAGGYTLSQVQMVDQFAYSPHIELVGYFLKS